MLRWGLIALIMTAVGCASIVEGTDQVISLDTPGVEGAKCELESAGGERYFVTTPGTVTVEKSKHDIAVVCKKEGYIDGVATIDSGFEGWTVGNLVFGGVIGLGVDAATGAINDYPSSVTVHMQKTQ